MHQIILQRETLERDLKLAREVQESFLPGDLPVIENYRFAAVNQPALEIGGDFYNFFRLPSDKLGIVLGDVSGKGISASLCMARLTSDLQYYALLFPEPEELLKRMNKVLYDRAKRGMFVTLVYLLLDPHKNRIQIANAGHLPPVYCDEKGSRLLGDEQKKGPPLGILPDTEYHQETFDLAEHSSITLFTDGVIEAKNTSAELFGIKRLLKVIKSQPNDPEGICRAITNSVDRFTATGGRNDDLTLLAFTVH
jgi:sigma-B regulation protein RsbU (phosphoserine phosphatase)